MISTLNKFRRRERQVMDEAEEEEEEEEEEESIEAEANGVGLLGNRSACERIVETREERRAESKEKGGGS